LRDEAVELLDGNLGACKRRAHYVKKFRLAAGDCAHAAALNWQLRTAARALL
jgi:hypothetical protein